MTAAPSPEEKAPLSLVGAGTGAGVALLFAEHSSSRFLRPQPVLLLETPALLPAWHRHNPPAASAQRLSPADVTAVPDTVRPAVQYATGWP